MNFSGKTVMVTGASGNLGRAVVAAFSGSGANVALVDRRREKLEHTFGAENERRLFLVADLLDQAQLSAAVTRTTERFARIDVLCNIAGGFRMGEPVHQTSDDNWNFLFDINARTLLHAIRAVVPQMIAGGGGKIVSIAAFAAHKGCGRHGRLLRLQGCGDPAD